MRKFRVIPEFVFNVMSDNEEELDKGKRHKQPHSNTFEDFGGTFMGLPDGVEP